MGVGRSSKCGVKLNTAKVGVVVSYGKGENLNHLYFEERQEAVNLTFIRGG